MTAEAPEETPSNFSRQIGARIRDIRRQQGLSLQAVQKHSGQEFRASVMGAYERGERVISVLRLQRLAHLFNVPVDQLLPDSARGQDQSSPAARRDNGRVKIDLARLERMDAPEAVVLRRYIGMLQVQRGDFNGRMITIRTADVQALARVFEQDEQTMRTQLKELDIQD